MQNFLQPVLRTTPTWTGLYGGLKLFQQEQNNFCGPACVQTALNYLNGTSPSQWDIAPLIQTEASGTYLTNMITFLNYMQSKNRYLMKTTSSREYMASNFRTGIVTYKAPPFCGISCDGTTLWRCKTTGHVFLITSARSDSEFFVIAAPFVGFPGVSIPGSEGAFYQRSSFQIYAVYNPLIGYAF